MALDTTENREELIAVFERLSRDNNFRITSNRTHSYNCIAWAMGFDDRWVDCCPDAVFVHKKWWPEGVDRNFRPETLVKAFVSVGFTICDNDSYEDGYDKVALYKANGVLDPLTSEVLPTGCWTHAARIIGANLYHSKMGNSFDIYHSGGDVFSGSPYGEIFQFMKRRIGDRAFIDKIQKQVPDYTVPLNIIDIVNGIMKE